MDASPLTLIRKYRAGLLGDAVSVTSDNLSEGGESDSDASETRSKTSTTRRTVSVRRRHGLPPPASSATESPALDSIAEAAHLKELPEHTRDVLVPMAAISRDLHELTAAVASVDLSASPLPRLAIISLRLWLPVAADSIRLYADIVDNIICPFVAKRAAVPATIRTAHVRAIACLSQAFQVLHHIDTSSSHLQHGAELQTQLVDHVAGMKAALESAFHEVQHNLCTLLDAHFVPREYVQLVQPRVWARWMAPLDPADASSTDIFAAAAPSLAAACMPAAPAAAPTTARRQRGMSLFARAVPEPSATPAAAAAVAAAAAAAASAFPVATSAAAPTPAPAPGTSTVGHAAGAHQLVLDQDSSKSPRSALHAPPAPGGGSISALSLAPPLTLPLPAQGSAACAAGPAAGTTAASGSPTSVASAATHGSHAAAPLLSVDVSGAHEAALSPASLTLPPEREIFLAFRLPWLVHDFEPGSEEEDIILRRVEPYMSIAQRGRYVSVWRPLWTDEYRALLTSLVNPSVPNPLARRTPIVSKCGCL